MRPPMSHRLANDQEPLFDRLGGRSKLKLLLHHFYADVRQHQLIGPIFNSHVFDWPSHLETIGDFWSTATRGPRDYQGAMPLKHIPLNLELPHFHAWLDLWRRNCRIHLHAAEDEEIIAIAETIGRRLHNIVTHHANRM